MLSAYGIKLKWAWSSIAVSHGKIHAKFVIMSFDPQSQNAVAKSQPKKVFNLQVQI